MSYLSKTPLWLRSIVTVTLLLSIVAGGLLIKVRSTPSSDLVKAASAPSKWILTDPDGTVYTFTYLIPPSVKGDVADEGLVDVTAKFTDGTSADYGDISGSYKADLNSGGNSVSETTNLTNGSTTVEQDLIKALDNNGQAFPEYSELNLSKDLTAQQFVAKGDKLTQQAPDAFGDGIIDVTCPNGQLCDELAYSEINGTTAELGLNTPQYTAVKNSIAAIDSAVSDLSGISAVPASPNAPILARHTGGGFLAVHNHQSVAAVVTFLLGMAIGLIGTGLSAYCGQSDSTCKVFSPVTWNFIGQSLVFVGGLVAGVAGVAGILMSRLSSMAIGLNTIRGIIADGGVTQTAGRLLNLQTLGTEMFPIVSAATGV